MEMGVPGSRQAQSVVYHVARLPLPVGHTLQSYALARDCHEDLEALAQARGKGPEAVARLLASEGLRGSTLQRRYPVQLVVLEAAFEWVRATVAPELPSRLDAVFAWETAALAQEFRDRYQPGGTIHRCRVVAGRQAARDGALVVAAYEAADLAAPSVDDLLRLEERARRYWNGSDPMRFPEVLVRGMVVVGAIIEDANRA